MICVTCSAKKKVNALWKFRPSSQDSKHRQRHAEGLSSAGNSPRMQPRRVSDMDAILFKFNNVTLSVGQGNLPNFMVSIICMTWIA